MFCKKCGLRLNDTDTYCPHCGQIIEMEMPSTEEYKKSKSRMQLLIPMCAFILVVVIIGSGLLIARPKKQAVTDGKNQDNHSQTAYLKIMNQQNYENWLDANINKGTYIVYRENLLMSPVINTVITDGQIYIGEFERENDAEEVAEVIRRTQL